MPLQPTTAPDTETTPADARVRRTRSERMLSIPAGILQVGIAAACWAALAMAWRHPGIARLNGLELPLARWFNRCLGHSRAFDQLIIFLNRKPGEALCAALCAAAFLIAARRMTALSWRRIGLFSLGIFVIWLAAHGIADALESTVRRGSPAISLGADHIDLRDIYGVRVKTTSTHSFPSNHGTVFFVLLFACAYAFGRRVWWMLPFAVVLSLPRVFAGSHWPSDTLIGSVLIAWPVTALAAMAMPRLARKQTGAP